MNIEILELPIKESKNKIPKGFKFDERTIKKLKELSKDANTNETEIVEFLINNAKVRRPRK